MMLQSVEGTEDKTRCYRIRSKRSSLMLTDVCFAATFKDMLWLICASILV